MHMDKSSHSTALTAPVVVITTTGTPTAGAMFTLTCNVTVVEGLIVPPTIEWVDAGGMIIASDEDGIIVNNAVSTLDLVFNPLNTSHGGEYTCRATINIQSINITNLLNSHSQNVIVQSEDSCYFSNGSVQ